jgi:acetyl-CoA carboxylase carboxyl transferase subunit beta
MFHKKDKKDTTPVPDEVVCEKCSETLNRKLLNECWGVCPKCDFHFEISGRRRIELLLDSGSFTEMDSSLQPVDALSFTAKSTYLERLKKSEEQTGLSEACIIGRGKIENREVAFGVTDPFFMRGSMGSVVGERIARLAEYALSERLPMIFVSGSGGGARMDEGMFSLMQMAKVSSAIGRLRTARLLYISVLTNPTMGGAMASFAALGDIVVAEPGALIGFAGPNVIKQTIKTDLPEGFQRSEFLLEKGFIDKIVHRHKLKSTIARVLDFCLGSV